MNLAAISFKGSDDINIPSWVNRPYNERRRQTASTLERQPQKDEFNPRTNKGRRRNDKHKKSILSRLPVPVRTFAAGMALTLAAQGAYGMINQPNMPNMVYVPFDSQTTSIEQLAEIYDTDVDFILEYNNISDENDLNGLTEIQIPSGYDYLDTEINRLQDKLYSTDISEEERAGIEEQIQALIAKQELQHYVANVYSDGEYVYYSIISPSEDAPEEFKDKYKHGINVETFKDLFDIEDKAIRRYNDIDYSWDTDDPEYGYYKDYTTAWLHKGDVIKVPVSAIQTDNINLDDFITE